ncbi:MAG: nucleotide sugar dehydrogenase [Ferrovibrionaceae bacterium]
MSGQWRIAVIGLGYVGLPLAVALSRHFQVIGFDISEGRVAELARGHDRTREVPDEVLAAAPLQVSSGREALRGADVYIITVPTPVDASNQPDLGAVLSACDTVGAVLGRGATVVLESTVYPGVTEEICGPRLAAASGMVAGRDFFLGYSPERINPGDREHTVERITKVVAGQTAEITERLAEIYGRVTTGGVFRAASIKTAEAAKVIENAQRDINIAFINEVTQIFNRLGLSIYDVLAASATKWNFLNFRPGLVGGHCIGVDPYYLAACANTLGHGAEVILSGRRINDGMGAFVADQIAAELAPCLAPGRPGRVLMLGLTFKENVPDLRNTKVIDLVERLRGHGLQVDVHDPLADPAEARHEYGLDLLSALDGVQPYDAVVGAVAHDAYLAFTPDDVARLLRDGGLLADVKNLWRGLALSGDRRRWTL